MPSLSAHNLGKRYKLYPRPRARLAEWMSAGRLVRHESLWAVRGVDLRLEPGESVGIVGPNGAGKSTLLKILAGTTTASEGAFEIEGRVAALLELGIGFHPGFSGRENATLSCQLMGVPRAEISERLASIQSFSELGDAFVRPLRTYSSGMQLRLAFSVATCVRPEVLIVDEALSVGDAYFQHRCIERIRSFLDAGTTLLLVSHDPNAVLTLCQRALLIEDGTLQMNGEPRQVLDRYQAHTLARMERDSADAPAPDVRRAADATSIDSAALDDVRLVLENAEREPLSHLTSGERLRARIEVRFARGFDDPHIGFGIKNRHGLTVYETNTRCAEVRMRPVQAGGCIRATFSVPCPLAPGDYTLIVGVANGGYGDGYFENSLFLDNACGHFRVLAARPETVWAGIVDLAPEIEVETLEAPNAPEGD